MPFRSGSSVGTAARSTRTAVPTTARVALGKPAASRGTKWIIHASAPRRRAAGSHVLEAVVQLSSPRRPTRLRRARNGTARAIPKAMCVPCKPCEGLIPEDDNGEDPDDGDIRNRTGAAPVSGVSSKPTSGASDRSRPRRRRSKPTSRCGWSAKRSWRPSSRDSTRSSTSTTPNATSSCAAKIA